jgi:hypothetical protein
MYLDGDWPVLSLGLESDAVGDDVVVEADGGEVALVASKCCLRPGLIPNKDGTRGASN